MGVCLKGKTLKQKKIKLHLTLMLKMEEAKQNVVLCCGLERDEAEC